MCTMHRIVILSTVADLAISLSSRSKYQKREGTYCPWCWSGSSGLIVIICVLRTNGQSAISALQVQEIESREVCRVKQNTAMMELCHVILAGCDTLLTSASCSKACVAIFTCLFTSLKLYTPHSLTTRPRLTLQMHIPSSPSP